MTKIKEGYKALKHHFPLIWRTSAFLIILCEILVILNADLIYPLFSNTVMTGWDGSAHMAIGKIYAENIFPDSWGWLSEWYLGMPFPQFYPPLFFFFTALLSKVLFFLKYETVFRIFILSSLCLTPCLITFLAYKLSKNKLTAGLSGIMAVILMSYRGVDLNIGVGIGGTINTGLLANSLAFNFLILWLINFLSESKKAKNYFFGVILLSAVFLTNVHLIFPAFMFFVTKYLFEVVSCFREKNYKQIIEITFKYYLPYGFLALAMTSYWLLPMLGHYEYFATTTLNIDKDVIYYYAIIFCYVPFFFGMIFLGDRPKGVKMLTFLISVLAIFITVNTFVKFYLPLPLHVIRWISPVLYLSAIPIADVFTFLYEQLITRVYKFTWLIFVLVFIAISSYASLFAFRNFDGIYSTANEDGLFNIIEFLKKEVSNNKNSLTLVEADTSNKQPVSFAVDSLLGQNNIPTVFSNLRESSMSGLYLVPLRNLFSNTPEAWGIQSFLAFDDNFLDKTPLKNKINMTSYFGVSSIVTSSNVSTEMLAKSQKKLGIKKVLSTSKFSVFDIPQSPNVLVANQPLVAVFSDLKIKEREWDKLSFSRLSEEWMNHFDPNVIFVKPNSNLIENNPVFSFTKIALLDHYIEGGFVGAKNTLSDFIKKGGKVFVVINKKEDLSLVDSLKDSLDFKDVESIQKIDLSSNTVGDTYKIIEKTLSQMIAKKTAVKNEVAVSNFEVKRNEMNLELNLGKLNDDYLKNNPTPILIKRSYFPDWKSNEGEVYLASPSFMLFVPKAKSSVIEFTKNYIYYLGYAVSLLALVFLASYSIFLKKKKNV